LKYRIVYSVLEFEVINLTKLIKKVDLYQKLLQKYKETTLLGNINSIAFWDFEVMMPKKGVDQRSEELAFFGGLIHERNIDPKIGSLLSEIQAHEKYSTLTVPEKRNIELMQRDYDRNTKLPKDFVVKRAKHGALATEKWKEAKKKADFSIFRDALVKSVAFMKQQAAFLDPENDPYDVLLNLNEHGFTKKVYDKIFAEVKAGLIPIIKKCVDSPNQPDMSLIKRDCPAAIQKKVAIDLAGLVEYDLDHGRIDVAVHPFSTGFYDDVRITVSYNEKNFTSSFYGAMHESGHAMYSHNYPKEYKYQPLGEASSSAMHEGQARFIENVIGRSPEFWEFYLPRFKKITGKIFEDVQSEPFNHALNAVIPSKYRIFADPVTYSLHVIVRYEIEKDLFAEKITVNELPQIWNAKMKEYLGVAIENDAEGLLQDTHWAWYYFAYFPTYSLGSYYNGQFVWKLSQDIPDWKEQMRQGKLSNILNWLNVNIRNKGALYDPLDLVKEVTGKEFSAKYFIDNTQEKCSKFYGF